ncbi:MAG TPA: gamma-glutamylcyclotransferase family protein [Thermomicrobiaceae bacterium]|nr:gamma-glutamylcyclotransferase family protein [Thermomicrobiaceae bacterium]
MVRYFAYCTLLDVNEMRRFVPEATPTITARLEGYRVRFAGHGSGGGCDLEVAPGHVIHGLIYELTDEEAVQLDDISGVGKGAYRRLDISVRTDAGETVTAVTYVIPNPVVPFRPSPEYTRPILAGARYLRLPDGYVAELEALVQLALDA